MTNDRFRVSVSSPKIKDKIQIKILDGNTDKIYWYIKFNLKLDKATITAKNMQVMDTDGYIMRTYIAYDTKRDVIVVSPMDSYIENKYYILIITTRVTSAKGQPLKKELFILFKLINNEISKFDLLKSTARIPTPKKRPKDYDERMLKTYSFSKFANKDVKALTYQKVKINYILPIMALICLALGIFLSIFLVLAAAGLAAVATVILLKQLNDDDIRSKVNYNFGTYYYNKEQFAKAKPYFEIAIAANFNNEQAEYALDLIRRKES